MFRGLDTDRSGDLGIGEVQAALKKLQAEADGTASQRDQEQVGGLRARVVALRQVGVRVRIRTRVSVRVRVRTRVSVRVQG